MTLERNTFATSIYIDVAAEDVTAYLSDGMNLGEYTLFSRMQAQVDATTWQGSASGYQAGLYYHVRRRDLGAIQIVEWHCGRDQGVYHHVYPMLVFGAGYFSEERATTGTHYHWISFVDPARATTMIVEGMPAVHSAEARSLKAQLERRAGRREPSAPTAALASHTIYVDAPLDEATAFLGDRAAATAWGFMLRDDGSRIVDAYGHPLEITTTVHDVGGMYRLIEHDTRYLDAGPVVRTPILLIPAAYAFAEPSARGVIMHRISAWPVAGARTRGKTAPADYDAEAINAKRILEARAGNLATYARGCSYVPHRPDDA